MSGPRKDPPRPDLGLGLRRYVPERTESPAGNGPSRSGNGRPRSGNGSSPDGDGPAATTQKKPARDLPRPARSEGTPAGVPVMERRTPMATPRRLGEILLMARQSRGIELERAARDTKIRARYLAALEAGDFRELPGTVYTKGFLRNYAQYLGLDPDVVIGHYKRELGGRAGERVSIVSRTLRAPSGGLTITPGLLVAGVLTVAVIAFLGYIGLQFVRFAQPPVLTVSSPATVESTIDAESTVISGTATAGATITITGADGPTTTSASSAGDWTATVPLRKGRNEFIVVALDPQTSKKSAEEHVIVVVPLPTATPVTVQLTLSSPADGASFTTGTIPIAGTSSGSTVKVSATYGGPPSGASPTPATQSPPAAAPATLQVGSDGAFSGSYQLSPGRWALTVTASGSSGQPTTITRNVTVAAPTGVKVVVEIKGGRVWLRVRIDGVLAKETPAAGAVFPNGTKLTFTAKSLVEIRTGVPAYTYVTANGVAYGPLATSGGSMRAWAIGPTGPPQPE